MVYIYIYIVGGGISVFSRNHVSLSFPRFQLFALDRYVPACLFFYRAAAAIAIFPFLRTDFARVSTHAYRPYRLCLVETTAHVSRIEVVVENVFRAITFRDDSLVLKPRSASNFFVVSRVTCV